MSTNARRPQIPQDMRAFNEKLIAEIRANKGQIISGPLAGSRPMVLTTIGARSGAPRTVVIGFRMDGDRYLAIASNNASDAPPHWYGNLLHHPQAVIEVGADRFEVRARTAEPDERPKLAAKIDYLERQQALTSREIPIVILERV